MRLEVAPFLGCGVTQQEARVNGVTGQLFPSFFVPDVAMYGVCTWELTGLNFLGLLQPCCKA